MSPPSHPPPPKPPWRTTQSCPRRQSRIPQGQDRNNEWGRSGLDSPCHPARMSIARAEWYYFWLVAQKNGIQSQERILIVCDLSPFAPFPLATACHNAHAGGCEHLTPNASTVGVLLAVSFPQTSPQNHAAMMRWLPSLQAARARYKN